MTAPPRLRALALALLLQLILLPLLGACEGNLSHPDPLLPWTAQPGQPMSCTPNLDGRIDANEMKAALGIDARYRISAAGTTVTVDTAGKVNDEGQRVWDWSAGKPGDRAAVFGASAISMRWYAASFEAGAFVVPLDPAGQVEAIYRHDSQALWLLGTASAEEKPAAGQTLLVYETPVPLFRFPLQNGSKWTATSKISKGTLYGLPWVGQDTYTVQVDATGRLELPDLTLTQAHRVRIDTTVTPAIGPALSQRRVSFVFECLGEVARATSQHNEVAADFSVASEQRRLGL